MNERMGRAAEVSRTPARRKFQGYKPEKPKVVRMQDVREDRKLAALVEAYKAIDFGTLSIMPVAEFLESVEKLNEGYAAIFTDLWEMRLDYGPGQVEKLSVLAPELQKITRIDKIKWAGKTKEGELLGLFFSALINLGGKESYRLYAGEIQMDGLGYRSEKNIEIFGDVRHYLGARLRGGSVVLQGNCRSTVGQGMTAGEIHVNGTVFDDKGKPAKSVYERISPPVGGKIFHNGKLVFDK